MNLLFKCLQIEQHKMTTVSVGKMATSGDHTQVLGWVICLAFQGAVENFRNKSNQS